MANKYLKENFVDTIPSSFTDKMEHCTKEQLGSYLSSHSCNTCNTTIEKPLPVAVNIDSENELTKPPALKVIDKKTSSLIFWCAIGAGVIILGGILD